MKRTIQTALFQVRWGEGAGLPGQHKGTPEYNGRDGRGRQYDPLPFTSFTWERCGAQGLSGAATLSPSPAPRRPRPRPCYPMPNCVCVRERKLHGRDYTSQSLAVSRLRMISAKKNICSVFILQLNFNFKRIQLLRCSFDSFKFYARAVLKICDLYVSEADAWNTDMLTELLNVPFVMMRSAFTRRL